MVEKVIKKIDSLTADEMEEDLRRYGYEPERRPAPAPAGVPDVSQLDLLQIARETGLRQHLHGLNACASRVMLLGFVEAVISHIATSPAPDEYEDLLTFVESEHAEAIKDREQFSEGYQGGYWDGYAKAMLNVISRINEIAVIRSNPND